EKAGLPLRSDDLDEIPPRPIHGVFPKAANQEMNGCNASHPPLPVTRHVQQVVRGQEHMVLGLFAKLPICFSPFLFWMYVNLNGLKLGFLYKRSEEHTSELQSREK